MSSLPWLPSWLHDGESFWSVANKLAFVVRGSVKDVLDLLLGPLRLRREALMFTDMPTAFKVCTQLDLPVAGAGGAMFAGIGGTPELGVRERWCLRVRYCPQCIEGCVHKTAFQDQTVTHCPVHKVRLRDGCERCGRALDPLCAWAWTCNHCGHQLADPGGAWSRVFRAGPSSRAPARAPEVVNLRYPDELIPVWQLMPLVYEEHAAMAHAFLARHRDCADHEPYAGLTYIDEVQFSCPVVASVLVCGAKLGLSASAMRGGWPADQAANCYRSAFPDLHELLWGVPEHQVAAVVRRSTRILMAKCLADFREAARQGKSAAEVVLDHRFAFQEREGSLPLALLPRYAEDTGRFCPNSSRAGQKQALAA